MTEERGREAGLTLVEVLVALALFALIGAAGLTLLDTVIRVSTRTEGHVERLSEIDRAFLVLRRDLAQMAPGPVALDPEALSFQRAEAMGAVSERIHLDEGVLRREVPAPGGGRVSQRLLPGVESARWRLLDAGRRWREDWPGPGDADRPGPAAAELTLRLEMENAAGTEIVRLFALPEIARR